MPTPARNDKNNKKIEIWFWGLGPRFSKTARRALQDVLYTFFSKKFQIHESYFELKSMKFLLLFASSMISKESLSTFILYYIKFTEDFKKTIQISIQDFFAKNFSENIFIKFINL